VHLCLPLCIFNYICTDFTAAFSVLNECTHKTHKTMAKTEANAYPKVGRWPWIKWLLSQWLWRSGRKSLVFGSSQVTFNANPYWPLVSTCICGPALTVIDFQLRLWPIREAKENSPTKNTKHTKYKTKKAENIKKRNTLRNR